MTTTFDEESANKELVKHPSAITFALVSATDNHSCTVRLDDLFRIGMDQKQSYCE